METQAVKETTLEKAYFVCKIINGFPKFECLSNEKNKFVNPPTIQNLKFENKQIYLFEKLDKKGDSCFFIENKTLVIKINNIALSENIAFNSSDLYSFIGKIIKKETTQILFLTSINKIVALIDIGEKFKDYFENQCVSASYVTISEEKNGIIYFKTNNISKFELTQIDENNQINQKISIKFNILDYHENFGKDILIKKIGIKLPTNNIMSLSTDKKITIKITPLRSKNDSL